MTTRENEGYGYVRSLEGLTLEIRRVNEVLKGLRAEKKRTQRRFYEWMERYDLSDFGGYKKKNLAEKPARRKIKPKADRQRDTVLLFRDVGIPDPEAFYEELKNSQYAEDERD